ncbi:hypothetical protein VCUG_00863 [Vavraia culicis subsp. floridensis]|uniref:Uncharacterized protein n=1 Tax=Vavraia culicis (isolate floridensis) TaxID=948595 RepID=L2GWB5_VAVCU|nr:uncharacterized protein VCUG_00863 [Vavraia culicis subsp. floridensis]ELA47662.1 hypothetical protein VCUG_00863 [Vavraia culicis subsp. floridensis]
MPGPKKKSTSTKYARQKLIHVRSIVNFYTEELSRISTDADLLRSLLKRKDITVKVCEYAFKEVVIDGNFFMCLNSEYYASGNIYEIAQVLHCKLDYIKMRIKELARKKTYSSYT